MGEKEDGSAEGGHGGGCCGPVGGGAPGGRSAEPGNEVEQAAAVPASGIGQFFHGGHLLHMVPMLLILAAPRLGARLTVMLAAGLVAYYVAKWTRRRLRAERSVDPRVGGTEE